MTVPLKKRRVFPDPDIHTASGRLNQYQLEGFPRPLWKLAKQKAKNDGYSMKSLIIRLLEAYVAFGLPIFPMTPRTEAQDRRDRRDWEVIPRIADSRLSRRD